MENLCEDASTLEGGNVEVASDRGVNQTGPFHEQRETLDHFFGNTHFGGREQDRSDGQLQVQVRNAEEHHETVLASLHNNSWKQTLKKSTLNEKQKIETESEHKKKQTSKWSNEKVRDLKNGKKSVLEF